MSGRSTRKRKKKENRSLAERVAALKNETEERREAFS